MKVYVFDLLAYGKRFTEFEADRHIPYPLPKKHFDPEIAARTYAEHFEVWREMDKLGYDGVGLNEHHTTPHGLQNSPNMMAAAAAVQTKNLKFKILGHILPIHNPLRIAEETAMADCIARGRVLPGFARGMGREYGAYGTAHEESRGRYEEAVEVILKAWTQETFSHEGRFWKFNNVSIWPRPYQQPRPEVWIPFTGTKETMDFAAKHDFSAVVSYTAPGHLDDVIGYFGKAMAKQGHRLTPDKLCCFTDAWVADDKAAALREYAPNYLYFNQTLWHHGSFDPHAPAKPHAPPPPGAPHSYDYVRPENRAAGSFDRAKIRSLTPADVEKKVHANELAWGSAKDVTEKLIDSAERMGANSVLLNMNVGALDHKAFFEQIRRFGREVLPALKAHQVTKIPALTRQAAD